MKKSTIFLTVLMALAFATAKAQTAVNASTLVARFLKKTVKKHIFFQ